MNRMGCRLEDSNNWPENQWNLTAFVQFMCPNPVFGPFCCIYLSADIEMVFCSKFA